MNKIQQAGQLLQQGKLKDAESIYRDLLDQDANNGMALWGMGRIAAAVQHHEAAIDFFARAAAAMPGQHLPVLDLATLLERAGRGMDAGKAYAHALELAPEDLQARFLNARYLVASGELERAEAALREILADEPAFAPG